MFDYLKRIFSSSKDSLDYKVKFYPLYPLAATDCPIIPAAKFKRPWIASQKEAYKKQLEGALQNGHIQATSTHRCPGLMPLFTRGFILTAHRDIFIHTTGDIENPEIKSFPDITNQERLWRNRLAHHNHDVSDDPTPFRGNALLGMERPYPERTPNVLFKFISPWIVEAPPDVVLLITDVPFSNNNDFTIVTGILDTNLSRLVQPILWWHHHDRPDIYIKKGTPFMQFIPISRRDYYRDFEIVTDRELIERQIELTKSIAYMTHTQYSANYQANREAVDEFAKIDPTYPPKKCPFGFGS
jgi:hypothetical protein